MKPSPSTLAFALLASLTLPALASAATDGPDLAGYTWSDSDEPNVDARIPFYSGSDLRSLGFTGDDTVLTIPLPLAVFPTGFRFYGVDYPNIYLSSNGWLSFVNPGGQSYPTPSSIPNGATKPDAFLGFYWADYTLEGVAPYADAGPNIANDGYTIFLRLFPKTNPNQIAQFYITLYNTGIIKIIYLSDVTVIKAPGTSIGIENETGAIGLPYMTNGTPLKSALFRSDYAVWFFPKAQLDCTTSVTPLVCGAAPIRSSNLAPLVNKVAAYNCATGSFAGNEKVFQLNVPQTSNLTITLDNSIDGKNRKLFFMRPTCSELSGCTLGGAAVLQPKFVQPGTYYVVVDGGASDNGDFNISAACQVAAPALACNASTGPAFTSGPSGLTSWSCAGPMSGPENAYTVNLAGGPATLRATLRNKSNPDLNVILSDTAGFNPASPSCLNVNNNQITQWNTTSGNYFVTVDGVNAASGSYELDIECSRKLACPSPARTFNPALEIPVNGDTSITGVSNNDAYYCASSAYSDVSPLETAGYAGPEDIYEFTLLNPAVLSFLFNPSDPRMRLLILKDCYEGSCVMEGGCGENLQPGTYRLVIDGQAGAAGPYTFTPFLFPTATYTKWFECPREAPNSGQTPGTLRLKDWGFNSGTFCDNGCAEFSLFAVVECGQKFHIPFRDVETGRMKIYDVFQSMYVDLKATNVLPANAGKPYCPYTMNGKYVEWLDRGCPGNGGNDCISNVPSNDLIMDVSFQGTPNTCGVFKLEFIKWGGFVWNVFANCSENDTPQWYLYRDLCSAIANYNPLPEIGIERVDVDNSQCGSLTAQGTMTFINVGCLPASNMEIVIEEVGTVPLNFKVIPITLVNKGETIVLPWSLTLINPNASLSFKVDPVNRTLECSEQAGGNVSCGASGSLKRDFPAQVCPFQCITAADAGSPVTICEGEGTRLSGAASVFSCLSPTAEYRWEFNGNPIPGCDWNKLAVTCDVPPGFLPNGTDLIVLKTRCQADNPPCETTASTFVTVVPNVMPPTLGNVLAAYRAGDAARMSWAPIQTVPISAYRIFKDADKRLCSGVGTPDPACAAASRSLMLELPNWATSTDDLNAIVVPPFPIAYYQVVGVSCLGNFEGPY